MRPTFHIKARWLTFVKDGPSIFFELDGQGNLVRTNGEIRQYHQIPPQQLMNPPKDTQLEQPGQSDEVINRSNIQEKLPLPKFEQFGGWDEEELWNQSIF
jgi:hypothetical protein